ncbi:MAG: glutathione S-transferase [Deltaproteobacteria bacterium]|nr:glutathione S-transferase [Deltaproteobacteria bacterium]
MRLFSAAGCPSAQRVRALQQQVGLPHEPREIDLSRKPADSLAHSPTGAVPVLEDDGLVLFESTVICEYLAERHGWRGAWSPDIRQRARERLAIKRFDDLVAPLFFQSLQDTAVLEARPQWRWEVALLGQAARDASPTGMLGLLLAPNWLRMGWLAPDAPVARALRDEAGAFLDQAMASPAVAATSPDRAHTTQQMRARLGLGL